MRKSTIIVLAVIIVFALLSAGCSDTPTVSSSQASSTSGQGSAVSSSSSTNASPATASNVTVDEQVLMDTEGIKVTLKSLNTGGFMGPELKLLIENDGTKSVTVQARDVSINGIMVNPMFSCDVEPGKKANSEIIFMSSELKTAGIDAIKDVELKLHVIDSSSYNALFDTEPINVTTSADYVQKYDDSGTVALDSDGIKVVVKSWIALIVFGAQIFTFM